MNFFQRLRSRSLAVVALLALSAGMANAAATITILNNDGAGEGFNDPTVVAPVGGNPGVTLGQQRLNVFSQAASIWGSILTSAVTIVVRAQFNAQTCTPTSAVLGSAGPVTIHANFAGAPFANTWYHAALANKLTGADLSAGNPDINATFNSQLDSGACLGGLVWYYGFDGNEGVNIELLPVVLHEMGHGLGFSTTTNGTTGNFNGGLPSIYDKFLFDNTVGLHWESMTPGQRVASAVNTGNLVWDGAETVAQAATFLTHPPRVVNNTNPAQYAAVPAAFGPQTFSVTANLVVVDDGVAPNSDGCTPIVNAIAGNIALIDRGTCTFLAKAQAAQAAGAVGIIIANNVAGLPPNPLGGSDPTFAVPVVGISLADATTLKTQLGGGPVSVTLDPDPAVIAGADAAGHPLMYAPNPFQGGSSVSHWDVTLTPNALMEPFINSDLSSTVDLTVGHFRDIGWFPGTTAVAMATFTAAGRADGILLRWQFGELSGVNVITLERARGEAGPWSPVQTELGQDGGATTALDTSAEPNVTYYYRLNVRDSQGNVQLFGPVTGRREGSVVSVEFLGAPKPNPAAGLSTIAFRIAKPEFVRLSVLDVNGRKVATIHEGMMLPGDYSRTWNARNDREALVAPGVYFFALTTSEGMKTTRLAVIR
jgi:hypothetical protein